MKGPSSVELDFRIRATHAGRSAMGFVLGGGRGLHRLKRELFLGKVVESGVTGLEAFSLTLSEYSRIDSCVVKCLE
eukprot:78314-Pyramimonas_sp.AAC.1